MFTLHFQNKYIHPVNINWMDDTTERLQAVLRPGESYRQGSWQGQQWKVRDKITNKEIVTFLASKNQDITIKGDSR